jgi:hypothetical protein
MIGRFTGQIINGAIDWRHHGGGQGAESRRLPMDSAGGAVRPSGHALAFPVPIRACSLAAVCAPRPVARRRRVDRQVRDLDLRFYYSRCWQCLFAPMNATQHGEVDDTEFVLAGQPRLSRFLPLRKVLAPTEQRSLEMTVLARRV